LLHSATIPHIRKYKSLQPQLCHQARDTASKPAIRARDKGRLAGERFRDWRKPSVLLFREQPVGEHVGDEVWEGEETEDWGMKRAMRTVPELAMRLSSTSD
jgi:hypothetical protein